MVNWTLSGEINCINHSSIRDFFFNGPLPYDEAKIKLHSAGRWSRQENPFSFPYERTALDVFVLKTKNPVNVVFYFTNQKPNTYGGHMSNKEKTLTTLSKMACFFLVKSIPSVVSFPGGSLSLNPRVLSTTGLLRIGWFVCSFPLTLRTTPWSRSYQTALEVKLGLRALHSYKGAQEWLESEPGSAAFLLCDLSQVT